MKIWNDDVGLGRVENEFYIRFFQMICLLLCGGCENVSVWKGV